MRVTWEIVTPQKPMSTSASPQSTLVFTGWQFPMLSSRAVNIYIITIELIEIFFIMIFFPPRTYSASIQHTNIRIIKKSKQKTNKHTNNQKHILYRKVIVRNFNRIISLLFVARNENDYVHARLELHFELHEQQTHMVRGSFSNGLKERNEGVEVKISGK